MKRFALLAMPTVVITALLFHYLDHLPQAGHIGDGSTWQANGSRQLLLQGLAPGPIMALEIGTSRQVRLIAPPGSTVMPALRGRMLPTGQPLVLRMAWTVNEAPAVTVAIAPAPGISDIGLLLQARDVGAPGLALRPVGAPLVIEMAVAPDSRDTVHGGIALQTDPDAAPQPRLRITTPPGQQVVIMLPGETALRAGLGSTSDSATALSLRGFATSDEGAGGRLAIADIVCGTTEDGSILWQRMLPKITLEDCRSGGLTVSRLVADKGLSLTAAGIAFVRKDDKTTTWGGLQFLQGNIVIQALIAALLATLTGWLGVALGPRSKA